MSSTKEEGLPERIRKAIADGRLPAQRPAHTWGGRGSGAACAVCGEPITPEQHEFELEYDRAGNGNGHRNLHVHLWCCSSWESELGRLLSQAESAGALNPAEEGGNMRRDEPCIE